MKKLETKYTPIPGHLDDAAESAGGLDRPNLLRGYAARFDEPSQILFDKSVCKGPFIEVIKPGAFARTLRENDDIRALFDHDKGCVLGRTKAGTLTLAEDQYGLEFLNPLPNTSFARDLRESMRRGDIDGCSFFGYVVKDEVELRPGQPALRTIYDIELVEITPATAFPAYLTAKAALRSRHPEFFDHDDEPEVVIEPIQPPAVGLSLARARITLARH